MRTSVKHDGQMARVRLSEGISLIFDEDTLSSSASPPDRSRSRSHSSGQGVQRRGVRKSRRSSSGSSSSNGSSRSKSRSRPRCHRNSSRRRCCHPRGHGRGHRSPPRPHSPSSPSPDKPPRRMDHRSRSRSPAGRGTNGSVNRSRCRSSRATSYRSATGGAETYRRRSRSRYSGGATVSVSLDGAEEKIRPTTPESHSEPEDRNSDVEPEDEDGQIPDMFPNRKIISFSINNSVAKPTVVAGLSDGDSKVTHRVMSFTSTRPYGQWLPVRRPTKTAMSRPFSKQSPTTTR